MPRIRSLKPGFCRSEPVSHLTKLARLHFILLWTYADDEGRGLDNMQLIKSELWPFDSDVTARKIDGWQAELARQGRIIRYECEGRRYFQIVNWEEHQHPNRPIPSTYPSLSEQCVITADTLLELEGSRSRRGGERCTAGAVQLPADFEITDAMKVWAKRHVPRVDINWETEKFIDWCHDRGTTSKSWVRRWQNWMRKANDYLGPDPSKTVYA